MTGIKKWDDSNDSKLNYLVGGLIVSYYRLILCTKNTGAWLNVKGNTVIVIVLLDTEFFGFLCANYYVTFPQHPDKL